MHGHICWAAKSFPRHLTTSLRVALASILAVTTPFATAAATAADGIAVAHCSQRYEDAMRVLEAQRYAAAFACLAGLADRGDRQAARMTRKSMPNRSATDLRSGWFATTSGISTGHSPE